jgi:hypothetical protein
MDIEAYRKIQAEHGRKGGLTTFKRIGRKGMSKIGKRSRLKKAKSKK